jgi:hypothetical protein
LEGVGTPAKLRKLSLAGWEARPEDPWSNERGPLGDHEAGGGRASSGASAPAGATAADISSVGRFVASMESMVAASARRVQAL